MIPEYLLVSRQPQTAKAAAVYLFPGPQTHQIYYEVGAPHLEPVPWGSFDFKYAERHLLRGSRLHESLGRRLLLSLADRPRQQCRRK
ncbi:hypothetical protein HRbin36_02821 [bacterium HR36]|nr:hypothetical protein HRbin36_02821 [bacterium HR36]